MQRYFAFLRGVNVGGRIVRMERLRRVFGALGFADVETFIASGNVTFLAEPQDTAALERRIEAALEEALGYPVATFIRTVQELHRIARYEPFSVPAPPGSSVYLIFVRRPLPASARQRVLSFCSGMDELAVKGREIYWRCRGSMHESAFSGARLEQAAALQATMRNRNTIVRLAARYPPAPRP